MAKGLATGRTSRSASSAGIGPDDRVVILHGKEAFLRGEYTEKLEEQLLEAHGAVDVIRFEGGAAPVADVLDECRSLGLMDQHKLVVVDEADELVKDKTREGDEPGRTARKGEKRPRELLERYAANPSESATLVLRAESWRPGKLDKLVQKVGAVIKCDDLPPARAAAQVRTRAEEQHGVAIDAEAIDLLIERAGTGLARLSSELAKLATVVGEGGAISASIVDSMVEASREEKAWTIQDDLLNSDPEPALLKLHQLLEVSRVDPVPIRWACIDLARKAHVLAREIESGVPARSAGKSLKLWGPSGSMARECAARAGSAAMARLLHEALECDHRAKTSQSDPVRGLERLILQFARVGRT